MNAIWFDGDFTLPETFESEYPDIEQDFLASCRESERDLSAVVKYTN